MAITSVSVDKIIRDKAAKRAKGDMISFSAVVRILLNDYANGKIKIGARMADVSETKPIVVDEETQNLMDDVIETWDNQS